MAIARTAAIRNGITTPLPAGEPAVYTGGREVIVPVGAGMVVLVRWVVVTTTGAVEYTAPGPEGEPPPPGALLPPVVTGRVEAPLLARGDETLPMGIEAVGGGWTG
jgi:hypothetical protein